MMMSLAFIPGLCPLVVAEGASQLATWERRLRPRIYTRLSDCRQALRNRMHTKVTHIDFW